MINLLQFRTMLLQHLICAIVLIGIAVFTIECSLFPWMKEKSLHAFESNRYLGERARIDGDWAESHRCFAAALSEANKLGDRQRIQLIESEVEKLNEHQRAASQKLQKEEIVPPLVWPSRLDYSRSSKQDRAFSRWETNIKFLLQQQASASKNDPVRLIELGDALFDMAQFASAEPHYLRAVECSTENLKVHSCALDRAARIESALKKYSEAESFLNQALKENPKSKIEMQLHLVQLLIDRNKPDEGERLCASVLANADTKSDPKMQWYEQLLTGICQSKEGKHESAIANLSSATTLAEKTFGAASKENLRTVDELFSAYIRAGRSPEAAKTYVRLATIQNEFEHDGKPESPGLRAFRDGEHFLEIDEDRIAIWLWEWSLAEREKFFGNTNIGVAKRLYCLVRAYRKVGDREKMLSTWKRAKSISATDPNIK